MAFPDRSQAGRRLGERLRHLRGPDVIVLGLPRGGVPVAAEVARALGAPLDVVVVRKLGVPRQPELAMGAIGEGGIRVVDEAILGAARVTPEELAAVEAHERCELARRAKRFRGDRHQLDLRGRTAVIVDDGIATGSTARAACRVVRAAGAARIILAVPVAPPGWDARFAGDADECVALETPAWFSAVGEHYADFHQVSDDEVVALLQARPARDDEVEIDLGAAGVALVGHLMVPAGATGVVVFAHGSGSTRHSPRNLEVASVLQSAGLGTLLFDLLTPVEARDRASSFDIPLLAQRLTGASRWLRRQPAAAALPVGWFGASTGAGAALWAAAEPGADVAAIVSRGGRPDLAGPRLAAVVAPTLLIVGGDDDVVLGLNRAALAALRCERRLEVVPGATHLFEEPGTLSAAAALARDWFTDHLEA